MANTFTKARPEESKYYYSFISANFSGNQSASTAFYVPLNGYIVESTSATSGEYYGIIAPHDGTLEKVILRGESVHRDPIRVEFMTAVDSNDEEIPATQTGYIDQTWSSGSRWYGDVVNELNFSAILTGGVNTFSKHQLLGIQLTSSYGGGASIFQDTYVMVVFKYDVTT